MQQNMVNLKINNFLMLFAFDATAFSLYSESYQTSLKIDIVSLIPS